MIPSCKPLFIYAELYSISCQISVVPYCERTFAAPVTQAALMVRQAEDVETGIWIHDMDISSSETQ